MMSNSEARKRAQEQVASAGSGGIAALAEIIHRALEPVGAEGAPKCPQDGEGFVGCYAAAGRLLRSGWLAADRAEQRRLGAEAVVAAVDEALDDTEWSGWDGQEVFTDRLRYIAARAAAQQVSER